MFNKCRAKKILVVDDEPNIVRTVADRLKMKGYGVVTATNGEEAVEVALAEKPDLILLDIVMPKLDGNGALVRLRRLEATRHIPVFMLTAMSQAEDVTRAIAAGALDYVVKPFDLVSLLEKIETILAANTRTG